MGETSMVEKVALALFEGSIYQGYNAETKRAEWLRTAGIHRAQARRAIAALKAPSARIDAMICDGFHGNDRTIAMLGYERGLDAALSEPERGE